MDTVIEALDAHAYEHALLKFSVDRDESDSYDLSLSRYALGNSGIASNLQSSDLMNLLPTGTSFRKAVGWRNIFGAQFFCHSSSFAVIGIEQIVPHSSRGAFPRSSIYLYSDLALAAAGLRQLGSQLPMPVKYANKWYGIYNCNSQTPDAHRAYEASTISCAIHHWTSGTRFLFRTLLIDESSLRLPGHRSRLRGFGR